MGWPRPAPPGGLREERGGGGSAHRAEAEALGGKGVSPRGGPGPRREDGRHICPAPRPTAPRTAASRTETAGAQAAGFVGALAGTPGPRRRRGARRAAARRGGGGGLASLRREAPAPPGTPLGLRNTAAGARGAGRERAPPPHDAAAERRLPRQTAGGRCPAGLKTGGRRVQTRVFPPGRRPRGTRTSAGRQSTVCRFASQRKCRRTQNWSVRGAEPSEAFISLRGSSAVNVRKRTSERGFFARIRRCPSL